MINLKLSNGTKLDIKYPIKLKDKNGKIVYIQWSSGSWTKYEYTNGKRTYYEDSSGNWEKCEFTDGERTYCENSKGDKWGTPKSNKKQAILDQIQGLQDQIEELKKQAEAL
jgi:hypothetical protein